MEGLFGYNVNVPTPNWACGNIFRLCECEIAKNGMSRMSRFSRLVVIQTVVNSEISALSLNPKALSLGLVPTITACGHRIALEMERK